MGTMHNEEYIINIIVVVVVVLVIVVVVVVIVVVAVTVPIACGNSFTYFCDFLIG